MTQLAQASSGPASPEHPRPEPTPPEPVLPEPQVAPWPAQGDWTWEDYLRLPDDGNRYEIIEGVLYVTAAPIYDHQFSVSKLFYELQRFILTRDLGIVLAAPFDVRLPGVTNPVQPDLLFIRADNLPQAGDKCFQGVPDLIVEVLSPGTSRVDQEVKLAAYEKAGVPEYWLADPKTRRVTVHTLDAAQGKYDELGRFGSDDSVRSGVLQGFETAVDPLFPPRRFGN